jgi:hypothetical protein
MANVDQFDYMQSMTPQGVELNKPYVSKNYNFINDINNGVYSNSNGLTLVQYDLTSIFNSSTATNPSDHFLIVPTVTAMQLSTNLGASVAPNAKSFSAVGLKSGTNCTVHSADIAIDGRTVVQIQPFTNIISNINLVSQMSVDDLKLHGRLRGLSLAGLDNPNSMVYTPAVGAADPVFSSQPGIVNNQIFNTGTILNEDQTINGIQNFHTCNTALKQRTAWAYNASAGGSQNNFIGTLNTTATYNQELRPYSEIVGNFRVWYNYLYINLGDLFPVFSEIGILRRFGAVLRIYFNTGIINTVVQNNVLTFDPANGDGSTTFTNTCPLMINNLGTCAVGSTNYSDAAFTQLTAGFFIGSAPNYTFPITGGVVNFNGLACQIRNTRYYYSSILLDSLKYADYLASNQSKTIVSKSFLYNNYTNITPQTSWSQLIQSGVKNIRAVMVIPLVSSVINNFSQFASPFDPTGGCGGAPLSLINYNVSVGGVQQLSTNLTYTYENFVEQISIYNKNSHDFYGVESGLISYEWWLNNRIYICNIRSTADDDLSNRNIVVQFTNNNNVAIDILFYTLYDEEWTVNVATGSFTQKM